MNEIGFALTGMAWIGSSRFLPDWNGWECGLSVLARLELFYTFHNDDLAIPTSAQHFPVWLNQLELHFTPYMSDKEWST
jgi:hypothetical protein